MFITEQDAGGCRWRKARYSANDGACVEIGEVNGRIAVRDSKNPDGAQLRYPVQSWRDFTANIKRRGRVSLSSRTFQTLAR
jgi:Domain of unknown function (DUF397)